MKAGGGRGAGLGHTGFGARESVVTEGGFLSGSFLPGESLGGPPAWSLDLIGDLRPDRSAIYKLVQGKITRSKVNLTWRELRHGQGLVQGST